MNESNIITTQEEVKDFGLKDYLLLIGEGEFIGTLDHKHWEKSKFSMLFYHF